MESIKIVPKWFKKERVRHSKDLAIESLLGQFLSCGGKQNFHYGWSTFKMMYFNTYEIKISYTLIHEVAILAYSAPVLSTCMG